MGHAPSFSALCGTRLHPFLEAVVSPCNSIQTTLGLSWFNFFRCLFSSENSSGWLMSLTCMCFAVLFFLLLLKTTFSSGRAFKVALSTVFDFYSPFFIVAFQNGIVVSGSTG
jgi:hypothetical protein